MAALHLLWNLHWTAAAGMLCLASALYLASLAVYRAYLHPLAGYPGPWLGRLTEWNTTLASLAGESTRARHAWALRHGPGPVRVGPGELLFSDAASVRDIYGQASSAGACVKDPAFYGPFTVCGARNVFNALDRAEHARVRRLFSRAFSAAEVRAAQGRVVPIIEKCLGLLGRAAQQQQQPVDLYEPFSRMFLDVISELSFDRSFDTLGGNLLTEARWADQLQNISALVGMCPFIEWVPVGFVQEAVRARPLMIEFARERIRDFRDRMKKGLVRDGSLLKRVVETKVQGGEQPLSDLELMENAIVFIQAGSETSMSTLLYLLYEVDRNPGVKEKLVREIRDACPADVNQAPTFESIEHLVCKFPFLFFYFFFPFLSSFFPPPPLLFFLISLELHHHQPDPPTNATQALPEPGPRRDPPPPRPHPRQPPADLPRQGHRRPLRPRGDARLQPRVHDAPGPGRVPGPGGLPARAVGAGPDRGDAAALPPLRHGAPELHRDAPRAHGPPARGLPAVPAVRPPARPGDDGGDDVPPGQGRHVAAGEEGAFPRRAAQVRNRPWE